MQQQCQQAVAEHKVLEDRIAQQKEEHTRLRCAQEHTRTYIHTPIHKHTRETLKELHEAGVAMRQQQQAGALGARVCKECAGARVRVCYQCVHVSRWWGEDNIRRNILHTSGRRERNARFDTRTETVYALYTL